MQIPEISEAYEEKIHNAILDGMPFVSRAFEALVEMHPHVEHDILEEWCARILWRFRFTDPAQGS